MDRQKLTRIASELRAYNPAADEYKGEHIHKVWAREIDAAIAALHPSEEAQAPRGMPEQIAFERKLTCEAINGAIAFGYQGTNVPPSDDHWLAPYWNIGRAQAELREAARQFHNLTQGDSTVIIRAPSAEKRDAIVEAGIQLREQLIEGDRQ